MQKLQFFGDGIRKSFPMPFPGEFITAVSGGGTVSGDRVYFIAAPSQTTLIEVSYENPAFGFQNLTQDADLLATQIALQGAMAFEGTSDAERAILQTALQSVIGTRASQDSVNTLGGTLSLAITAATSDKATTAGQAIEHTSTRGAVTVIKDTILSAIGALQTVVVNAITAAKEAIMGAQATADALVIVRSDVLAGQGLLATTLQLTAAKQAILDVHATAANLAGVRSDVLNSLAPKATTSEVNLARDAIIGVQATAIALAQARVDILAGQTPLSTTAQATANKQAILDAQSTGATSSTANQSALLTAIAAAGVRLGEVKRFTVDTPVPAGFTQNAGAPLVMPTGIFGMAATTGFSSAGGTNARNIQASDGVHSLIVAASSMGNHQVFNEDTGVMDARTNSVAVFATR